VADPGTLLRAVDEERLGEWLREQRWFGAKAADLSHFGVLDVIPLRDEPPLLACALVQAVFNSGTHDLYQLLVGLRQTTTHQVVPRTPVPAPNGDGEEEETIAELGDSAVFDALTDPAEATVLLRLMERSATIDAAEGTVTFQWTGALPAPSPRPEVRSVGAEQSNSTVVFDEKLALKVFRRLLPGENPELEMLRFLQGHEFPNIAQLAGWYEISGERLQATLGVLQRYVAGGRDGWAFALAEPQAFLERAAELGEVTGRLHTVLASDMTDPDFAPEDPGDEALGLIVATIDEDIERVFLELSPDDPLVEPIVGRGEEVRDRLQMLGHQSVGGKLIRHHGDYHLGQTLLAPEGWVILDFEGEPARTLPERRRKRSPLRDVAGMLRSFAYAASAMELLEGRQAPEGWEADARARFLDGYFSTVEPALLPAGEAAVSKLLSIYELEKAVYELRYELNNRPDWVKIPVAAIVRLLDEPLD
jgi:predicted trehalose synthase